MDIVTHMVQSHTAVSLIPARQQISAHWSGIQNHRQSSYLLSLISLKHVVWEFLSLSPFTGTENKEEMLESEQSSGTTDSSENTVNL